MAERRLINPANWPYFDLFDRCPYSLACREERHPLSVRADGGAGKPPNRKDRVFGRCGGADGCRSWRSTNS